MAILAGINCWRVLAALITMMILILADVIFVIAAYYEVPKLRSLPTNGTAIAIMATVPIIGAVVTFSCWKPGPPEEDVPPTPPATPPNAPVNSPASSSPVSAFSSSISD